MATRALSVLAGTVLLAALAPPATAQKHVDPRLGFELRPPKDFRAIALSPSERITVAKYQSEQTEYGSSWGQGANPEFEVRFYPNSLIGDSLSREDYIDKLWGGLEKEYGYSDVSKEKSFKIGRLSGVEKIIEPQAEDKPFTVHAVVLDQEDGIFVFRGVTLRQRYKKYASDYSKAIKSFSRIEKADASARAAELAQMDDQERFLQRQIDRLPPGWRHLRTKRYLFLYSAEDGFVKGLSKQIEAIRDVYEEFYPPSKPIEAVSIVRVCGSRDEYIGYGGSQGSGGYWNSRERELVVFDAPPRSTTEATINHEAFHQYIYYFYGELSPHSWYNEGQGDYFGGARMTKTYRITGFGDMPEGLARRELAKEACRLVAAGKLDERGAGSGARDLMKATQQEYYSKGVIHYAQGWSLIHFLRHGKRLEPKWKAIMPSYLDNLLVARRDVAQKAMERHLEQAEKKEKGSSEKESKEVEDYFGMASTNEIQALAFEKTFADWDDGDWERFQKAWFEFVEKDL